MKPPSSDLAVAISMGAPCPPAATIRSASIPVYRMRSAARRDEVANYRLEMIVSGSGSSASGAGGSNVPGKALVSGTLYDATEDISCVIGQFLRLWRGT